MFRSLPTLNASPIFSRNKLVSTAHARRLFAIELATQLKKYGVARLSHHGVAPVAIRQLFEYHRAFFNLPLPDKLSVRHPGGESPARGYSPWAYEKTAVLRLDLHNHVGSPSSAGSLLDAREQFAVGPPGDMEFPTPQLAEARLPGFNKAMEDAYVSVANSCRQLVAVIEEGIGAPTGSISGAVAKDHGAELNLNFYPEVERSLIDQDAAEAASDVVMRRIWPHSDLGIISALFQDGVGSTGLETLIKTDAGEQFVPVSTEAEGDMVLLAANTLERWTNGHVLAAVHRVGFPSVDVDTSSSVETPREPDAAKIPERRSAVMFFRAPPTADVGPLPYFVSADNPAKYEYMTAREYLKSHNKKLY